MKQIITQNNGEDIAMYVITENGAVTVDIIQIHEYPTRRWPRYRVDFKGRTVLSLATLTECKKKAKELLKSYR